MDAQQLSQFESFAEAFYNPPSAERHKAATTALAVFQEDPSHAAQLKYVLDNSASQYAQLYATSCLNTLTQWHWNSFNVQTRVDIRNYLLNFLARNGPKVHDFLQDEMIKLLARITKLGWFDGDDCVHRKTPQDVTSFFQPSSPKHSEIGLKILIQLVAEVCQASVQHTIGQHRKTAVSFRDLALLKIFKLSLQTLRAINSNTVSEAEAAMKDGLKLRALRLAHLCITYDFVGTSPSETTEDEGTAKIPTEWRALFQDEAQPQRTALLDLFWDMYTKSSPPNNTLAMEILVELASVRRSLFSEEEARDAHLARIMNGITDVLRTRKGLDTPETFHQFSRLLARLKSNYQLSQIVNAEGYSDWIRLVSDFSIKTLQNWAYSPNSLYYVLTLWSRLVAAIPYLHSNGPSLLEEYAPQIMEAYLESRMQSVDAAIADGYEDPFGEDEENLFVQLDVLPYIGRLRYERTLQDLARLFDPLALQYEQILSRGAPTTEAAAEARARVEGKLSWLTYVIGIIVSEPSCSIVANALNSGRVTTSTTEEHNQIDAELSARVLKLMALHNATFESVAAAAGGGGLLLQQQMQAAVVTESKMRLELSILAFLQDFRKVYVGETSIGSVQMFDRLAELMNISESNTVLALMMNKLLLNFKFLGDKWKVIDVSMQLFFDLAAGYSSIRLLIKLPEMEEILRRHTSATFPFLDQPDNHRARVTYYNTLAKILHMLDAPALRREFMRPFAETLELLLARNTPEALRQEDCRVALVHIFLDLRGLTSGIYSRVGYERLFQWLYPRYLPVLQRAAEVWYEDPSVALALLKFLDEFTVNKSGRITFEMSSANGILLFKETSKILCSFGGAVLRMPPRQLQDPYKEKYKAVSLCLKILCNGLSGNYANFGVFKLYQDPALDDAINVCLQLVVNPDVPLNDLMSYPKLTTAYFSFLDRIFDSQVPALLAMDGEHVAQVLLSLQEGLRYSEVGVSTQCVNCLDHLASHWWTKRREQEEAAAGGAPLDAAAAARDAAEIMAIERQRDTLGGVLQSILSYVLFEDCPNQWSCSRAIFSLTLLCPDSFQSFKLRLIERQPAEYRQRLEAAYDTLMDGVTEDLESRTRDIFTRQLNAFRSDIRTFVSLTTLI